MIFGVLLVAALVIGVIVAAQGSGTFLNSLGRLLTVLGIVGVGYFVVRWAYTEYWITTHCTMVLGTRVCR